MVCSPSREHASSSGGTWRTETPSASGLVIAAQPPERAQARTATARAERQVVADDINGRSIFDPYLLIRFTTHCLPHATYRSGGDSRPCHGSAEGATGSGTGCATPIR